MDLKRSFLAPDGRLPLEGYVYEMSRAPGDTCRFMLSGQGSATVEVRRLVHGDPNPRGPGAKDDEVSWGKPAELELVEQPVPFGSYVEVPDSPALAPVGPFSLALWFQPTSLGREWQTLATKCGAGAFSYGVFVGGHRLLVGGVSIAGAPVEWIAGADYVQPDAWQLVVLVYDGAELQIHQAPASGRHAAGLKPGGEIISSIKDVDSGAATSSDGPLLLGASPEGSGRRWHFDGKLARPALFGVALEADALVALAQGADPSSVGALLGSWNLSMEVGGTLAVDTSGQAGDGLVVNAPARAVTGPFWRGSIGSLYTQKPEAYDAVHLHRDDLADACWKPSLEVQVPAEARSGLYCLRVEAGADELEVPFVIRPASAKASLCVVVPTFTWQAYSSNAFPWSHTEDGALDRGVCVYMPHSDGSMVYYVSRRKPTRSGSAGQGIRTWGAHTVASTLYLVDWLEEKRIDYDLVTDEDLHREGTDLLSQYRCVTLGSHAEYWTSAMLAGLRGYLDTGGRVVYLGGNGLYWVTSVDPARQYLIEIRKGGEGDFDERWIRPAPGESQHSTTLEVGGLWSRRGLPPRAFVGVEHAANVFEQAEGRWGFRRTQESSSSRYSWVFAGIDEEIVGNFGLNLGSAVGYEMDAALPWAWGAGVERAVLARAEHSTFLEPKRLPSVHRSADIALTCFPGGGTVFAAGSVTWTGSLSWNGYENNVSRMSENVFRRFMDIPTGMPVVPS
jgi:N,N-dimethylformamidase